MHDSDRPIVQLLVKKWRKMTVTLETRFNEVPRDWENVFIILRVCYIKHLHLTIFWENCQNVCYIEVKTVERHKASDISRKKKQNFAGFSGSNSRKNRPISRDFPGKKVKIRGKIGRFRGISAKKSQIWEDFQGRILRKIGRFHSKFRGETSARNNQ